MTFTQTNSSAILIGDLLQLGGGVFAAGTDQVSTLTFSGAPAVGGFTLKFWGLETANINTAAGLPTNTALQNAINAVFGSAYLNPFTVAAPVGNVFTITASASGPFAKMPLPSFVVGANTSAVTITPLITVPGVTQETYATVKGVEVMPWPGGARDIETYMNLDANGLAKRKVAKFFDNGDVQFTVGMTNDAQQNNITGFRSMFQSIQTFDWRIVEPTKTVGSGIVIPGSTYYFAAFLSRFQRDGNTPDSRQRWNCTLAIDGSVLELPPLA